MVMQGMCLNPNFTRARGVTIASVGLFQALGYLLFGVQPLQKSYLVGLSQGLLPDVT